MAMFTYSSIPPAIPLNMVCAKCNCRKGRHKNSYCPTADGKTYTMDLFKRSDILRTIKCDRNRNPERYKWYPR
jgi:hypothetical protein